MFLTRRMLMNYVAWAKTFPVGFKPGHEYTFEAFQSGHVSFENT